VRTILVVGGGYAGFYTAWKLEKKLRRGEAQLVAGAVTTIDNAHKTVTVRPAQGPDFVLGYDIYVHHSLGAVATLNNYRAVANERGRL
jgi:NADH:ubiquinone reductase (H+-translocating)